MPNKYLLLVNFFFFNSPPMIILTPHIYLLFQILFCSPALKLMISIQTLNIEHDWTPVKYLNGLHQNRMQRQLQHFIIHILQKYYHLLPILGTLGMHVRPLPSITIMPTCRNFDVYLVPAY